jgi:hypothetical protein
MIEIWIKHSKKTIEYNALPITSGLAQAGAWLARKFVRICKFFARPSGSESPACAKPPGRCAKYADSGKQT